MNEKQAEVEKLFNLMEPFSSILRWYAKHHPLVFEKKSSGWTWHCYDPSVISVDVRRSLKTTGFQNRKAAAEYLEGVFGFSLLNDGFIKSKAGQSAYWCSGYNFFIQKTPQGDWYIVEPHRGCMGGEGNYFSTRKKALYTMVDCYPEFYKNYDIDLGELLS